MCMAAIQAVAVQAYFQIVHRLLRPLAVRPSPLGACFFQFLPFQVVSISL